MEGAELLKNLNRYDSRKETQTMIMINSAKRKVIENEAKLEALRAQNPTGYLGILHKEIQRHRIEAMTKVQEALQSGTLNTSSNTSSSVKFTDIVLVETELPAYIIGYFSLYSIVENVHSVCVVGINGVPVDYDNTPRNYIYRIARHRFNGYVNFNELRDLLKKALDENDQDTIEELKRCKFRIIFEPLSSTREDGSEVYPYSEEAVADLAYDLEASAIVALQNNPDIRKLDPIDQDRLRNVYAEAICLVQINTMRKKMQKEHNSLKNIGVIGGFFPDVNLRIKKLESDIKDAEERLKELKDIAIKLNNQEQGTVIESGANLGDTLEQSIPIKT